MIKFDFTPKFITQGSTWVSFVNDFNPVLEVCQYLYGLVCSPTSKFAIANKIYLNSYLLYVKLGIVKK